MVDCSRPVAVGARLARRTRPATRPRSVAHGGRRRPHRGPGRPPAAVRDALRRGEPHSRWLIVFDNADQPEEIADLIPTGPGDVLITSRNHRWEAVIRTVPMDVFRPGESREFLLKRVRKGLTEADADRLAQELGHPPRALAAAR